MPDAVSVSVAKGVEAAIKGAAQNTLSINEFELNRSYAEWDLDLKDLDNLELADKEKLHVDVVAHTTDQVVGAGSRGGRVVFRLPIDIAVRRKFGPDKQDLTTGRIKVEEVDALVLFTEELHLLFHQSRMPDFKDAVQDPENPTQIIVCPVRQHLRELRQFTSIVRVTFRADKKVVVND